MNIRKDMCSKRLNHMAKYVNYYRFDNQYDCLGFFLGGGICKPLYNVVCQFTQLEGFDWAKARQSTPLSCEGGSTISMTCIYMSFIHLK